MKKVRATVLRETINEVLIYGSAQLAQKKGSGTICAKHPSGRSGKWCLTPFFRTRKRRFTSHVRSAVCQSSRLDPRRGHDQLADPHPPHQPDALQAAALGG